MTGTPHLTARPISDQHLFPGVSVQSLGLVIREAFTTSYKRNRQLYSVLHLLLRVNDKVCDFCVQSLYISLFVQLAVLRGLWYTQFHVNDAFQLSFLCSNTDLSVARTTMSISQIIVNYLLTLSTPLRCLRLNIFLYLPTKNLQGIAFRE